MLHRSFVRRVFGTFLLVCAFGIALPAQTTCREAKGVLRHTPLKGGATPLAPIDILHQRIDLDLTLGNVIRGACQTRLTPRGNNLSSFDLDLENLTVDSIHGPAGLLAFEHVGTTLTVELDAPLDLYDTLQLTIHYGGDPVVDASGFGGFYTSSALIYNLGVAFESVPHSYGRTWFPCLDNFTERSTYEFHVRTAGGKKAWCNGSLVGRTQLDGDTLLNHWECTGDMPAYLVSVAAANYAVVHDTLPSIAGVAVPTELVGSANDTADMRASFTHLPDAFQHFETRFGPYRWQKVGYVLTTAGAMEHSTSIHYPTSIADGTLAYEATMAHELAHHWFGNLVTCDRAEEMYINEGFAEYLSYLFLEHVYGRERYMAEVRSNHRSMVHRAHLVDEGWWSLSEMPQEWTYGTTTYNKGADVLHTLRSYMGDEAFFEGLTSFLGTHAFQPVNTTLLRDHLTATSGQNMNDFFADWIQQPGWAAFEIDSQAFMPGEDGWVVQLELEQKQRGPAAPYSNVPLTFTVVGSSPDEVFRDTLLVGGATSQVALTVPFEPAWVWLNDDERLSLAFTGTTDTVTTTANLVLYQANIELRPNPGDTTIVRAEQYWVPPDQGSFAEPFAWVLSPDRYWRITGNWNDPQRFEARIGYDGRNTITTLDPGLMQDSLGITFHEDSLALLYRRTPWDPWIKWSDQVVNLGSDVDGFGRMEADSLMPGEYALAWRTSPVTVEERMLNMTWELGPNPTTDVINIRTDGRSLMGTVRLFDGRGRLVRTAPMNGRHLALATLGLNAGAYTLSFSTDQAPDSFIGNVIIDK